MLIPYLILVNFIKNCCELLSCTSMKLVAVTQSSLRGFDWLKLNLWLLEFGISIFVSFSAILRPSCDEPVVSSGRNWRTRQKPPPTP